MLSAFDYLASQNLCHRDIKPQNILYDCLDSDKYLFQLADFGLAHDFRLASTFCGSGLYMAPELHNNKPQSPKMDMWSLFVTLIEIHPMYPKFPPTFRAPFDYADILRAVLATPGSLHLGPPWPCSSSQMITRTSRSSGSRMARS